MNILSVAPPAMMRVEGTVTDDVQLYSPGVKTWPPILPVKFVSLAY